MSPLERCFLCDTPTGRAGKEEDSIYCDECGTGPYCTLCFDLHYSSAEIIDCHVEIEHLRDQLRQVQEERNALAEQLQQAQAELEQHGPFCFEQDTTPDAWKDLQEQLEQARQREARLWELMMRRVPVKEE